MLWFWCQLPSAVQTFPANGWRSDECTCESIQRSQRYIHHLLLGFTDVTLGAHSCALGGPLSQQQDALLMTFLKLQHKRMNVAIR